MVSIIANDALNGRGATRPLALSCFNALLSSAIDPTALSQRSSNALRVLPRQLQWLDQLIRNRFIHKMFPILRRDAEAEAALEREEEEKHKRLLGRASGRVKDELGAASGSTVSDELRVLGSTVVSHEDRCR